MTDTTDTRTPCYSSCDHDFCAGFRAAARAAARVGVGSVPMPGSTPAPQPFAAYLPPKTTLETMLSPEFLTAALPLAARLGASFGKSTERRTKTRERELRPKEATLILARVPNTDFIAVTLVMDGMAMLRAYAHAPPSGEVSELDFLIGMPPLEGPDFDDEDDGGGGIPREPPQPVEPAAPKPPPMEPVTSYDEPLDGPAAADEN